MNILPQEKNLLKSFFDTMPYAVLLVNRKGKIIESSHEFNRFLNYSSEEILNKTWSKILTEKEATVKKWLSVVHADKRFNCETEYLNKNGERIFAQIELAYLSEELDVIGIFHNISGDEKSHQTFLRGLVEKFQLLIEFSPNAVFVSDSEENLTFANSAAGTFLNCRRDEIIGKKLADFLRATDYARLNKLKKSSDLEGIQNIGEFEFISQDGRFVWGKLFSRMLPDGRWVAFVNDITEFKRLEIENNKLAAIVESSEDAIICNDFYGKISSWNQSAEKLFGFSVVESIGENITLIVPSEKISEEAQMMRKIQKGGRISNYETIRQHKDGKLIEVSISAAPIKNVAGKIAGTSTIIRDITKRNFTQNALRESEERYRVFIEQSTEGIWRFEMFEPVSILRSTDELLSDIFNKSYLAECNDAMAKQHGFERFEQLKGKKLNEILVDDNDVYKNYLQKFIESDFKLVDYETREIDSDGNIKFYLNNLIGVIEGGNLIRAWGIQRDITVTKQAEQAFQETEAHLRQSTKIEAIGRLAGGIAHDFNNFLAVIMLHVDMLNLQLPPESPLRFRINEIKAVSNSAAEMVRQLLAFGRKQAMQPHPIILNLIVKEFIKIIRPIVGEDIEIQVNLEQELGVCFVDHNQLVQVLMNLAINARDAMPFGGSLEITTRNIKIDRNTPRHKAQPKGPYVELIVSDTGIGMERKIQQRIFEPFFTTKESGKGTGLGLATVYGIVKQSNGFIWVESKPKEGSSFIIQFPRIDQAPSAVKKEVQEPILRGSETILLVEDEEKIRRAAVELMIVLGYQVMEASNGYEAIELAQNYDKPIHLLLTDVVMPRMNGKELSEKITALHSETKILFMSGYNDEIIDRHGVLNANVQFLSKPFSPATLALKVREVLESKTVK